MVSKLKLRALTAETFSIPSHLISEETLRGGKTSFSSRGNSQLYLQASQPAAQSGALAPSAAPLPGRLTGGEAPAAKELGIDRLRAMPRL